MTLIRRISTLLIALAVAGCGVPASSLDLAAPDLVTADRAVVTDWASPDRAIADLAVASDFAAPSDFAVADLAVADLALTDLAIAPDLAVAVAPDLATPPDLFEPDLAHPDLESYLANCNDGIKNGFETDIDCGGGICKACGGGRGCKLDLDCLTAQCNGGVCSASCSDGVRDGDESDIDCGGSCTACPTGKGCGAGRDCASGVCAGGLCAAPTCFDKVQNGGESDIDCGGPCAPCSVAGKCKMPGDCASKACPYGVCAPATCLDGVKSGGESDIDCGGPCIRCGAGKACGGSGDCADFVCTMGRCVAGTCNDGVKNEGESDIDCGGPCAGCPLGKPCGVHTDCASGLTCAAGACAIPLTCQALKVARPSTPDGAYAIDPDGAGPGAPRTVFCEMTRDGGGWMLITPAMVDSELNTNCTVATSTDGNGGLAMQVFANQPGCGNPMASSHQVLLRDVVPWTQVRASYVFAGGTSCWGIFGSGGYIDSPVGNLVTFDPMVDTIRDAVRMGGSNGDPFDGKSSRCDNEPANFWHSAAGPAPRGAVVILRRKSPLKRAGLATGTSCAGVAAGMASPTWWKYADVYVR